MKIASISNSALRKKVYFFLMGAVRPPISALPAQVDTVFSLREGEGYLLRERIRLTIKRN
jgi:hypothetical protein